MGGYAVIEDIKIINYDKEGRVLGVYFQKGEVLKSAVNPSSFPVQKFHFKIGKDVKVKMKRINGNYFKQKFKIISVEEN